MLVNGSYELTHRVNGIHVKKKRFHRYKTHYKRTIEKQAKICECKYISPASPLNF